MISAANLTTLQRIGLLQFEDIIVSSSISLNKLRFIFLDGSFLEIFNSRSIPERWAFQWERRHIDGTLYRHDNIPHPPWRNISSFPWHFHAGTEENVEKSDFQDDPIQNLLFFLSLIKNRINSP